MAILVTGGMGYIGSHTVSELLDANCEVIIADNLCNSSEKILPRFKEITGKSPIFYNCDVRDEKKLRDIFSSHKIDSVIHFAGLKAVGESCENPLLYYDNNINGTIALCRVMDAFNCRRLVFSSSATVYGDESSPPFKETDPTGKNIPNPYGRTKFIIEQILSDLYMSDNRWSICLLRYFNPVGAHKSGKIGENPNGVPNNLMPYITQVAVGKRKELSIFGNDYNTPDGTCIRDYIHIADLATGHLLATEKISKDSGFFVYNLGTGKGVSVLEFLKAFEEATDTVIPYSIKPRRKGDVAVSFSNSDKAKKELGFTVKRDLFEMCRDSWKWQKNNPNGYDL